MALNKRPFPTRALPSKRPREKVDPIEIQYTRSKGKQLTYTIKADGFGSYSIYLADKLLRTGGDAMVEHKIGNEWRYPLQRRLGEAVAKAKSDIEQLNGFSEE